MLSLLIGMYYEEHDVHHWNSSVPQEEGNYFQHKTECTQEGKMQVTFCTNMTESTCWSGIAPGVCPTRVRLILPPSSETGTVGLTLGEDAEAVWLTDVKPVQK